MTYGKGVIYEGMFYHQHNGVICSAIGSGNTTNNGTDVSGVDYDELNKILSTYVTPTLFFISVIGNSLIFAVFSMGIYKNNLTAMLYRVLAVTDGISVVIRVGIHALPITETEISCKIVMFIFCWTRVFSVWLIGVITAARVIFVWSPFKAKRINTMRRYAGIIAGLILAAGILYFPLLHTAGHSISGTEGETGVCLFIRPDDLGVMEWYRDLYNVSIMMTIAIILIFVIIANSLIVFGIRRSRTNSVSTSSPSLNDSECRKRSSTTIILLISSTSVIFNLPDVIYVVLSSYNQDPTSDSFSALLTLRDFLPVFDCINRSINIFFFCLFGKEFRRHLKELLCRPCKKQKSNPFVISSGKYSVSC